MITVRGSSSTNSRGGVTTGSGGGGGGGGSKGKQKWNIACNNTVKNGVCR